MRSREWRQAYVGYPRVAEFCNTLDGEGWSIHSFLVVPDVMMELYGDEKTQKQAVVILAWRALPPPTPTAPPSAPFR